MSIPVIAQWVYAAINWPPVQGACSASSLFAVEIGPWDLCYVWSTLIKWMDKRVVTWQLISALNHEGKWVHSQSCDSWSHLVSACLPSDCYQVPLEHFISASCLCVSTSGGLNQPFHIKTAVLIALSYLLRYGGLLWWNHTHVGNGAKQLKKKKTRLEKRTWSHKQETSHHFAASRCISRNETLRMFQDLFWSGFLLPCLT